MFPLCTKAELIRYRVPNLLSDYTTAEFSLHYFPIQESLEITDILEVLDRLRKVLSSGKKVALYSDFDFWRSILSIKRHTWFSLGGSQEDKLTYLKMLSIFKN